MALPNIVLVHGAWADGSCRSEVIERPCRPTAAMHSPRASGDLARGHVARVRQRAQPPSGPRFRGPLLRRPGDHRARHRRTERGRARLHRGVRARRRRVDRRAAGAGPPDPGGGERRRHLGSFGWIPEDDFLGHFAADIDPVKAKVMYAVQQPLLVHLRRRDGRPAWKSLPSWYLVAQNDEVIHPMPSGSSQRMGARPSRSRADTARWSPTRRRPMSGS